MPRPPVLGYLQSAVADNTAHSQMDKLLFEDEMSNIQPEWGTISNPDEGYDPAMEFAEGMIPIGGALRLLKGSKKWPDFKKGLSDVAGHEKKVWEVMQDAASTPIGKLMDKGGSDKAAKDYLTTLWIQRNLK